MYNYITKNGREFDTPYVVNKEDYKKTFGIYPPEEYIQFKIDSSTGKVGYAFYFKNRYGGLEISKKSPEIIHFIDPTRVFVTGDKTFKELNMTIEKI